MVVQHINIVETMTFFVLGKWIIEEQQSVERKFQILFGKSEVQNIFRLSCKKEQIKNMYHLREP